MTNKEILVLTTTLCPLCLSTIKKKEAVILVHGDGPTGTKITIVCHLIPVGGDRWKEQKLNGGITHDWAEGKMDSYHTWCASRIKSTSVLLNPDRSIPLEQWTKENQYENT